MPITNGIFSNWTGINASNSTAGSMVTNIVQNIPWAFTWLLVVFYIVIYIYMADEPGRKKYIYITFMGLLASIMMNLFSLVPATTTLGAAGLFIVTFIFVMATSD